MLRVRLILVLLSIITVLGIAIPSLVYALPASTDISGFYMAKMPTSVDTFSGDKVTYNFSYYGLDLEQTEEVVTGYIYGFNASSVTGCKVLAGTTTYNATLDDNRQSLTFGTTNITVEVVGKVGVYLKSGCDGTATNVTGTVVGSPVDLSTGWNTLNVTGNGTIAIFVYMPYTLLGTVGGISGTGSKSWFLLAGTDLITGLDVGNATITGVATDARIIAPGYNFTVTGNGTISVDMPPGNYGSASGESLTVNGEASVDLVVGTNTLVLAGAPGNLVVAVTTYEVYQFNGRYIDPWFGTNYLSGKLAGFIVTGNDPWDADIFSCALKATKYIYDPILN
jgi:hypothetical protein